jgi:hypothetical protein
MWFAFLSIAVAQDKIVWSDVRYEVDPSTLHKFEELEVEYD